MTSSHLLILLIIAFIAYSMMKKSESFGIGYGGSPYVSSYGSSYGSVSASIYGPLIPPLEAEVGYYGKKCYEDGYYTGSFNCDQYKNKSIQLTLLRNLASGSALFQPGSGFPPQLGYK